MTDAPRIIGYQCPTCQRAFLEKPAQSLCRGGGDNGIGNPRMQHRPIQVRPVHRIVTSAFRAYAEVYRQRALGPPEDGLGKQLWMWVCLQYAKHIEGVAEEHERAIDEGREEEFWASRGIDRSAKAALPTPVVVKKKKRSR